VDYMYMFTINCALRGLSCKNAS